MENKIFFLVKNMRQNLTLNQLIQTNKINNNKIRFLNLKNTEYLNHNFFEKKYLKLIIFFLQLFYSFMHKRRK